MRVSGIWNAQYSAPSVPSCATSQPGARPLPAISRACCWPGLAEDGGLFVPDTWPTFSHADLRALRGLPYAELAARVMQPFVGDSVPFATLQTICREAYAGFNHPAVAPLIQLDANLWALELFHGPTLAFKDMAMQVLGRLFDHVLTQRDERVTIVGATSGDTGSAAIEACRDRARVDIAILFPQGRTTEVQRRQMTTVQAPNVTTIAVDGTFDDCQDLVKAMFADTAFRTELRISAVNSINWARVAAQIPYYVGRGAGAGRAGAGGGVQPCPPAIFGNVLAAWAARRMGLPVARLVVASNRNDILARFLAANDMSIAPVEPSLSPSMDIAISSNFERLLFELLERDGAATAATMAAFRTTGHMAVPQAAWHRATTLMHGFRLDDEGTLAEIRRLDRECGYEADPHTAIGVAAARALPCRHVPTIAAATAHAAKFPDAMERATGRRPALPKHLADLYERPEHFITAPRSLDAVEAHIRAFAYRTAAL